MRFRAWSWAVAAWALLVGGCANEGPRPDKHTISPTPVGEEVKGRATLGLPIPIRGAKSVIVPFAIESEKQWFERENPFDRGWSLVATGQNSLAGHTVSASRVANGLSSWPAEGADVYWHNAVVRSISPENEALCCTNGA